MVEKQDCLSIAQQVDSLEDKLSLCRQALEEVDFKLQKEEQTSVRRKSLEKEKHLLEAKVHIYDFRLTYTKEKELKMLRWENQKTVALSAAILLLVVVIYTCWTM